ncbi:hypothetical protein H6784_04575 [Candidatus Nomurabacteria bacterium]|nr:hypothetical protein [Candidatus Kaiserbacteria bacterium]MCB9814663.1 hypothetical protein [Candidatus Nomurabacteria bacterium]
MKSSQSYFKDCDFSSIKNSLVILDIDGTIVPHNGTEVLPDELNQINFLKENNNRIVIVSNNVDQRRNESIAQALDVECIETGYRKPDVRAIGKLVAQYSSQSLFVIGDKMLTDGLFAKKLGGVFWGVENLRSKEDSLGVRIFYFIDRMSQKIFY